MLKNKKALALPTGIIVIFAIIGLVAGVLWVANLMGGKTTSLTVIPQGAVQGETPSAIPIINLVDKTTVTYSSWDAYVKSTNANSGHRILDVTSKDGQVKFVGTELNDDATNTLAPGDTYKVLLGNRTLSTEITSGTNYYPTYLTGIIPDTGAYTIGAGQYLTAGASQITFTFKNTQGTAGGVQALGTSDDKTVSWFLQPNANTCVGNPDTGGKNVMTYHYNSSIITSVQQYDNAVEESTVATPIGAQASLSGVNSLYSKVSFEVPVICGPGEITRKVRLKSGSATEPASEDGVNMTVSDISWGFNTNTYDLIKGYQNNNAVDLGMTDYTVGGLIIS